MLAKPDRRFKSSTHHQPSSVLIWQQWFLPICNLSQLSGCVTWQTMNKTGKFPFLVFFLLPASRECSWRFNLNLTCSIKTLLVLVHTVLTVKFRGCRARRLFRNSHFSAFTVSNCFHSLREATSTYICSVALILLHLFYYICYPVSLAP